MLNYTIESTENYKMMLKNTGALSKLFSESESPFLVSRSTENIYCEGLGADNLSRSDCTADARYSDRIKGQIGIGIKTFLHNNGRTIQKIAEFNKLTHEYRDREPKELILKIAELRNERIDFTKATHGLDDMIYHCITRSPGKILIFESPMQHIQIDKIKNIKVKPTTISFEDGIEEYSFNITKSTLYKRFDYSNTIPLFEIPVNIIEHPYLSLAELSKLDTSIAAESKETYTSPKDSPYVILPLFSDQGIRHVPERSGLNQWNAKGRKRNYNEIYIPIPSWIHSRYPSFFPNRDTPFNLKLPDKKILNVKVCQAGSKALMSNPNKDLGKWLLRQVFRLEEGQLLTYTLLKELDIDSVRITQHSRDTYSIDFCTLGTYDEFKSMT